MAVIFVAICGLVILLGFEIRHREIIEELSKLKSITNALEREVVKLNGEVKMKKNIYEESL